MTADNYFDFIPEKLLKDQNVEELVEDAYDFAHTNGIVFRLNDRKHTSDVVQALPMTLFPTPFPNKLYEQAVSVQDAMIELYHRIAWDHDFIVAAHQEVIETDDFTGRLLEIYEKVWQIGGFQTLSLSIQRADYMAHVSDFGEELKQIEVNHIAAGMGGMAQRLSKWHQRILKKVGVKNVAEKSPTNKPLDTVAEGLFEAWKAFGDESAAVLVVVEEVNQNQLDQKSVDYRLEEMGPPDLKIIRASLTKCAKRLTMRKNDLYFLETKIGVIYFRSGYSEVQYPSENEWNARLLMELSSAIKCPWIGLQLANTKKVQQLLALPGIVEKYFPDQPKTVRKIRATFAGLWGLDEDDPATNRRIKEAIKNPEKFVLKPQKEGGGGNFYGKQISEKLLTSTAAELAGFILMEKLNPLVFENIILRAGQKPKIEKIVSELSIFGYALGDGKKILKLHSGGHFLRSKNERSNECGLSVGAGALDTVFLY